MEQRNKIRIAWALKCKPEEVPEDPKKLKAELDERHKKLKAEKEAKKKNG